jgi:predicted GTPase
VLAEKPEVIAVTKADTLGGDDDAETARELVGDLLGKSVIPISSASGHGTRELLEACWRTLARDRGVGDWSTVGERG